MRILFIHISDWPVPVHGVATLVTVAREAGHEVDLLDLTFHKRDRLGLARRRLEAGRPQALCLSIYDDLARAIIRAARSLLPEIKIIFGGSHATLFPDELIADPLVDAVCIGDGEEALPETLTFLEGGKTAGPVDGMWIKQGGDLLKGDPRPPVDLATLPVPDWTLWDVPRYVQSCPVLRGGMYIAASRGCPYACTFCARHTVRRANPGRRYLIRPAEHVVEEIDRLRSSYAEQGLKHIFFLDHVFGADTKWLHEFTSLYRAAHLDRALPWAAMVRAEHVTESWAEQVQLAGCRLVEFGVETVDDARRYQLLGKGIARQAFEDAARNLKRVGIAFNVYLLVGIPGDTLRELQQSVKYAEALGARLVFISRFIPVRGTELGDSCRGQGLVESSRWQGERVIPDRMSEHELSAFLWWNRARRLFRCSRLGLGEQGPRFLTRLAREVFEVARPSGLGITHPLALLSTLDRQVNRGVFDGPATGSRT